MDTYASALGRILSNLQTLEFALRARLSYDDPVTEQLPAGMRLQDLKIGQVVVKNSLTSYETLGQLVSRYNAQLPAADADCKVDPTVVQLRDALAHGRISSPDLESDFVLLKFGRATGHTVVVEYAQQLSREWFVQQVQRLCAEIMKANEAMQRWRTRKGVSTPST